MKTLDVQQLDNLYDLIEYRGKALEDKPYMLHEEMMVSYVDYYKATCRAANGLIAQGGGAR